MSYLPVSEEIVDILVKKTQSNDPHFFRITVAYYMAKLASMMRTNIKTHDRGVVPVSLYALNLANSGFGKNFSTNIIEEQLIAPFRDRFINLIWPKAAQDNLRMLAKQRSNTNNVPLDGVLSALEKEFELMGALAFSFDSGTVPAIKQMRHKLLLAGAGSMCFEGDEVGSNFTNNTEVLNAFLELYDIGKTKQKLTKNTAENQRAEEIDGRTPTNLMLFGTPSKLLNGKTEEEFYSMLETGYARRLLFGYSQIRKDYKRADAMELYNNLVNSNVDTRLNELGARFRKLADPTKFNRTLTMSKETSIKLLDYRLDCEEKAATTFKEHQEIHKAEMSHRYFKALKLAGAYAFVEDSTQITDHHMDCAIQMAEDSGEAFHRIMNRDRNYVRIAKYLADIEHEVTQVDLMEDLPAYRGSAGQRQELMNLAVAWGYKNNIIIQRYMQDKIEFFRGEALEETDLDKCTLSYSKRITEEFNNERVPFNELYKLTTVGGLHYANHHFKNGYRDSEHVISGFNLIMIDVDDGTTLETAQLLLKEYTYFISTTKRHTDAKHRFRIILPMSHILYLEKDVYRKFMENVFDWLPFNVDSAPKDIARKWETAEDAKYMYNTGQLVDATNFIPQTKKETKQRQFVNDHSSMNNLERWFLNTTEEGNRNHMLIRFGYALLDDGYKLDSVREAILSFNQKLNNPLPEDEILMTIMVSLTKKFTEMNME